MRKGILIALALMLAFVVTLPSASGGFDTAFAAKPDKKFGRMYGVVKIKGKNERLRVGLRGTEYYKWTDAAGYFDFSGLDLGSYHLEIYDKNRRILYDEMVELSVIFKDYEFNKVFSADWLDDGTPQAMAARTGAAEQNYGRIYGTVRDTCCSQGKRFRVGLSNTDIYVWTSIDGSYKIDNLALGDYQVNFYESDTRQLIHVEQVNLTRAFYQIAVDHAYCCSVVQSQRQQTETRKDAPKSGDEAIPTGPGVVIGKVVQRGDNSNFYKVRLLGMGVDQVYSTDANGNFRFDYLPLGSYSASMYDLDRNFIYSEEIELTKMFPRYTLNYTLEPKNPPVIQPVDDGRPKWGVIRGQIADRARSTQVFQVELEPLGTKIFVDRNTGDYSFNKLPFKDYTLRVYDSYGREITNQTIQLTGDYADVRFDHFISSPAPAPVPTQQQSPSSQPQKTKSPRGSIYGQLLNKDGVDHSFRVGLSGTDSYTWTDPKNGAFGFDDLDLGNYQLLIYDKGQNILRTKDIHLTKIFPLYEVTETLSPLRASGSTPTPPAKVKPASTVAPKPGLIYGTVIKQGSQEHRFRVGLSNVNRYVWTNPKDGSFAFDNLALGHYQMIIYDEAQRIQRTTDVHLSDVFPAYKAEEVLKAARPQAPPSVNKPMTTSASKTKGTIYGTIRWENGGKPFFRVGLSGTEAYKWTNAQDGTFSFSDLEMGFYQFVIYDESQNLCKMMDIHLTPIFPTFKVESTIEKKLPAPKAEPDVSGSIVGSIRRDGEGENYYRVIVPGTDIMITTDYYGNFELRGLKLSNYALQIYDYKTHEHVRTQDVMLDRIFPRKQVNVTLPAREKPKQNIKPKMQPTSTTKPKGSGMIYGRIVQNGDCTMSPIFRVALGDTAVTSTGDGSFAVENLPYGSYLIRVYDRSQKLVHAMDVQLNSLFPQYEVYKEVKCDEKPAVVKPMAMDYVKRNALVYGRISRDAACKGSAVYRIAVGDTSAVTRTDGSFELGGLAYGAYLVRVYDMAQHLVSAVDIQLNSVFFSYELNHHITCQSSEPAKPAEVLPKPKSVPRDGLISGQITQAATCAKSPIYRVALGDTAVSTQSDGTFEIRGLAYGTYMTRVYDAKRNLVHSDDVQLSSVFPSFNLDLNLECDGRPAQAQSYKPGRITGQITKKGARDNFYRVRVAGLDKVISTNMLGDFEVKDLEYGLYHIVVYDKNQQKVYNQDVELTHVFPVYFMDVNLEDDKKPAEVKPVNACDGRIIGLVNKEGAKSLAYRVVLSGNFPEGKERIASTNMAGGFSFDDLGCGTYFVTVYDLNQKAVHAQLVELTRVFPTYNVEVKLPSEKPVYQPLPTSTLPAKKEVCEGKIYGGVNKKGVSDNTYRIVLSGNQNWSKERYTTSSASGAFAFEAVDCGSYFLTVYDMDQKPVHVRLVEVSQMFPISKVEVKLEADKTGDSQTRPTDYQATKPKCTGKIVGTLIKKGAASNVYRVVANGDFPDGSRERAVTSNASGNFVFDNLTCGSYFVSAYDMNQRKVHVQQVELNTIFPIYNMEAELDADKSVVTPTSTPAPQANDCTGKLVGAVVKKGAVSQTYRVVLSGNFADGKDRVASTSGYGNFVFDNLKCGFYVASVYDMTQKRVHVQTIELNYIFPVYNLQVDLDADKKDTPVVTPTKDECVGKVVGSITKKGATNQSYRVVLNGLNTKERVTSTNAYGAFTFDNLNCGVYFVTAYDAAQKKVHVQQVELNSIFPVYNMDVDLEADKPAPAQTSPVNDCTGKLVGSITQKNVPSQTYRIVLSGNFADGKDRIKSTSSYGNFEFPNLKCGFYVASVYDMNQKRLHVQTVELNDIFPVYNMQVDLDADKKAVTPATPTKEECVGKVVGSVTRKGATNQSYRLVLNGLNIKERVTSTSAYGSFTFDNLTCGTYFVTVYDLNQKKVHLQEVELNSVFPVYNMNVDLEADKPIQVVPTSTGDCTGKVVGSITKKGATNQSYRVVLNGLNTKERVTSTNAYGSFTFDNLSCGVYFVTAYDAAQKKVHVQQVELNSIFPVYNMDVDLEADKPAPTQTQTTPTPPAADCTGKVVGSVTKKGATNQSYRLVLNGLNIKERVTSTSAYGSFTFDNLTCGTYFVTVYDLNQKKVHLQEVELNSVFPVYNMNVDLEADKPIQVVPTSTNDCTGKVVGSITKKGATNQSYRVVLNGLNTKERVTSTNAYGSFTFDNLNCGVYFVTAYDATQKKVHVQQVELNSIFPVYNVDVDLEADKPAPTQTQTTPTPPTDCSGKVVGSITKKGATNQSYRVVLNGLNTKERVTSTNAYGSFTFDNLTCGIYFVTAYDGSQKKVHAQQIELNSIFPIYNMDVDLEADKSAPTQTTPTPQPKDDCAGKLVGSITQKGVTNQSYRIVLSGNFADGKDRVKSTSNYGNFEFPNLNCGFYVVSVYDLSQKRVYVQTIELSYIFPLYNMQVDLDAEKKDTTPAPAKPKACAGKLVGTITKDGLAPRQNYRVVVSGNNLEDGEVVVSTNGGGNFAFDNLKCGNYFVSVFDMNQKRVHVQPVEISNIFPIYNMEVDVKSEKSTPTPVTPKDCVGKLVGSITKDGAAPRQPYRLVVSGSSLDDEIIATTNGTGGFAFDNLKCGTYYVSVFDQTQKRAHVQPVEISRIFPIYNMDVDLKSEKKELPPVVTPTSSDEPCNGRIIGAVTVKGETPKKAYRAVLSGGSVGSKEKATSTNIYGNFTFDGVACGSYFVSIYDLNQKRLQVQPVEISHIFPLYNMEVDVEADKVTPVTQATPASKDKCSGQLVGEITRKGETRNYYRVVLNGGFADGKERVTSTNSSGSFAFDELNCGSYFVTVYDMGQRRVHVQQVEINHIFPMYNLDVELDAEKKDGSATVEPKPTPKTTVCDGKLFGTINKKGEVRQLYRVVLGGDFAEGKSRMLSTNSTGNFVFEDLKCGIYQITIYDMNQKAVHNQQVALTEIFPIYNMQVDLEADKKEEPKSQAGSVTPAGDCAGRVVGSVTRKGAPNASFRVTLSSGMLGAKERVSSTGAGGNFAFDDLPCGSYFVTVYDLNQRKVHVQSVDVNHVFPVANLDIDLEADKKPEAASQTTPGGELCTGKLIGTITRKGETVHVFRVALSGEFAKGKERVVTTNESGSFTFEDLPCGSYFVTVYDQDQNQVYARNIEINHVFPVYDLKTQVGSRPAPPKDENRDRTQGKGRITGRITQKGEATFDFRVALVGEDKVTSTNPVSGVFAFTDLPYGSYHLIVYNGQQESVLYKIINLNEIFPVYHVDQELDARPRPKTEDKPKDGGKVIGRVYGTIRFDDASRTPDFRVVVTGLGGDQKRHVTATDPTGYFQLEGLELGQYNLRVYQDPQKVAYTMDFMLTDIYSAYPINYVVTSDKANRPGATKGQIFGKISPAKVYRVVLNGTDFTASTDGITGTFKMKDVPFGRYYLSVYDYGAQKYLHGREIELSTLFPEFNFEANLVDDKGGKGVISGKVYDEADPGNRTFIVSLSGTEYFVKTNPKLGGEFTIDNLAFGNYHVAVYDLRGNFIYAEPATLTKQFPFYELSYKVGAKPEAPKPPSINGRIFGQIFLKGGCDDLFTVILKGSGLKEDRKSVQKGNGFIFEKLPYGDYYLNVFGKDRKLLYEERIQLNYMFPEEGVKIEFECGRYAQGQNSGAIFGNVIDLDNTKETFKVTISGDRGVSTEWTDRYDGYFRFDNLPFGVYLVKVHKPDGSVFDSEIVELTTARPTRLITAKIGSKKVEKSPKKESDIYYR